MFSASSRWPGLTAINAKPRVNLSTWARVLCVYVGGVGNVSFKGWVRGTLHTWSKNLILALVSKRIWLLLIQDMKYYSFIIHHLKFQAWTLLPQFLTLSPYSYHPNPSPPLFHSSPFTICRHTSMCLHMGKQFFRIMRIWNIDGSVSK